MAADPTRRRVLKAGGALAGGAWIAPSILRVDRVAAASATCVPMTFDWLASVGQGNLALGTFPLGGGINITITENLNNVGCFDTTSLISPVGTEFGGEPSWFELNLGEFNNPGCYDPGDFITTTFTFSQPVQDLSFTLYDVDRSVGATDGFQDQVSVVATPGSATPTYSFDSAHVAQAGDQFTGLTNATNSQSKNNVGVAYSGLVSSVTFTFTALPSPGGGSLTAQAVGVGNIGFCA